METKDRIKSSRPDPVRKTTEARPFLWIRSIILSVVILAIIGGIALVLGGSRKRPVDWVYINAIKGNQNINLPDGSNIVLRKGSALHYPKDFGESTRNVYLNGEAYFRMGNAQQPFQVETHNGTTSGSVSSFLISSRDSSEEVIVLEGSVHFSSPANNGLMIPVNKGEKAEIIGGKYNRKVLDGQNYLSWKEQRLVFDRTPLNKVVTDLYDYYGVPVRLASELNGNEIWVTGQFQNQSLDSVLSRISGMTNVLIRKEANIIYISKPETRVVVDNIADKKKPVVSKKATVAVKETDNVSKKKKKKWWVFWKK